MILFYVKILLAGGVTCGQRKQMTACPIILSYSDVPFLVSKRFLTLGALGIG